MNSFGYSSFAPFVVVVAAAVVDAVVVVVAYFTVEK